MASKLSSNKDGRTAKKKAKMIREEILPLYDVELPIPSEMVDGVEGLSLVFLFMDKLAENELFDGISYATHNEEALQELERYVLKTEEGNIKKIVDAISDFFSTMPASAITAFLKEVLDSQEVNISTIKRIEEEWS
ncbi:MAG: hypothetical protein D6769_00680 [Methanobacteriota archaeon]|nr:MAG: hypothetical protein D6769_00680 [Euryarchaeota archaeon]